MAHTYASVDQLKSFLVSNGNADFGTTDDGALLLILEGASRRVDGFTGRSRFGSGFGPRIASNVYDHDASSYLALNDDFIAITEVTSAATTGATAGALVASNDYLAVPSATPYRALVFPGLGTGSIGAGFQVLTVAGTAGYSVETSSVGTIGTVSASATAVDLSGGVAYPGMTLLVESEQMYVTAATGGTALTVARAVNGTTAATHAASTAASRYRYDRAAESGTLLVAQRRWRQKETGLTGDFGGGSIPATAHHDTEWSLLRSTVAHLRVFGAA